MITRQDLQGWIEEHRVQLAAEALGALMAMASDPAPAPLGGGPLRIPRAVGDVLRQICSPEVNARQAAAFAGYREGEPETVWYRAIQDAPWDGEFEALRALATDVLRLRTACALIPPLARVFAAAVTYRDCWTPRASMSVNQAARDLTDVVRWAEAAMSTDRDVNGRGSRR